MSDVKVLVAEVDGVELDAATERILSGEDANFSALTTGLTSTKISPAIRELAGGRYRKGLEYLLFSQNAGAFGVNSATYAVIGSFVFPGSNTVGVPDAIKAIVYVNNSQTGQFRLVDKTTGLVIKESATFSNTSTAIVTLTGLSNIPATESIFEIQLRRATGSATNRAWMSFFGMYWE